MPAVAPHVYLWSSVSMRPYSHSAPLRGMGPTA